MSATDDIVTMGQVADSLGCQTWKIRRLIERGKIPKPRRVGMIPIFDPKDVPQIEKALREAGYLKK